MRRANAQLQSDRRGEILAAAQRCFVRAGFHGASMQDICAEAGMSPGNLYRYFPSKEAIIADIAERDRGEVAQQFANADLSQGLFAVLEGMVQHYFGNYPRERVLLCTEIMSEARRHPEIARMSAAFEADVRKWLTDLLRAGVACGDIPGDVDLDGAVTMLMLIADGSLTFFSLIRLRPARTSSLPMSSMQTVRKAILMRWQDMLSKKCKPSASSARLSQSTS